MPCLAGSSRKSARSPVGTGAAPAIWRSAAPRYRRAPGSATASPSTASA
jgi:hypothetical protein